MWAAVDEAAVHLTVSCGEDGAKLPNLDTEVARWGAVVPHVGAELPYLGEEFSYLDAGLPLGCTVGECVPAEVMKQCAPAEVTHPALNPALIRTLPRTQLLSFAHLPNMSSLRRSPGPASLIWQVLYQIRCHVRSDQPDGKPDGKHDEANTPFGWGDSSCMDMKAVQQKNGVAKCMAWYT